MSLNQFSTVLLSIFNNTANKCEKTVTYYKVHQTSTISIDLPLVSDFFSFWTGTTRFQFFWTVIISGYLIIFIFRNSALLLLRHFSFTCSFTKDKCIRVNRDRSYTLVRTLVWCNVMLYTSSAPGSILVSVTSARWRRSLDKIVWRTSVLFLFFFTFSQPRCRLRFTKFEVLLKNE